MLLINFDFSVSSWCLQKKTITNHLIMSQSFLLGNTTRQTSSYIVLSNVIPVIFFLWIVCLKEENNKQWPLKDDFIEWWVGIAKRRKGICLENLYILINNDVSYFLIFLLKKKTLLLEKQKLDQSLHPTDKNTDGCM